MKCMKCGREMESEEAFCTDCLLEMKKYPVNPDVRVQLPIRPKTAPIRKNPSRGRNYSSDEQIRRLKKRIWILSGCLVVTVALLCAMIYPTAVFFIRNYHLRPGQNYNTVTTAETVEVPLD